MAPKKATSKKAPSRRRAATAPEAVAPESDIPSPADLSGSPEAAVEEGSLTTVDDIPSTQAEPFHEGGLDMTPDDVPVGDPDEVVTVRFVKKVEPAPRINRINMAKLTGVDRQRKTVKGLCHEGNMFRLPRYAAEVLLDKGWAILVG